MTDEKKNSVLIVDDERANIIALTSFLESDYEIYVSLNGAEAIEAAEEFLPDIILLDILMPGMDGYDTIAKLKSSEKTQYIPVIFITGLNTNENERKGLALGAADYITKPFSAEIVKLRVKNQIKIIDQMQLLIENEVAENNNRVKADFLSRMSHEMLTPMNSIIGMSQLIAMTFDVEDIKKYNKELSAESHRLLGQIHDLLDVSGKNADAFKLESAPFTFKSMFKIALKAASPVSYKKKQTLDFEVVPLVPLIFIGDEQRLAQVITNLLLNAAKFTPEQGEIKLSGHILEDTKETTTIQIEVIDNGIGISKEQQEDIFKLFEQVDKNVTRAYNGAGLGLPVAKRIIEMMDGTIWVESELGKGSKFGFTCKLLKG